METPDSPPEQFQSTSTQKALSSKQTSILLIGLGLLLVAAIGVSIFLGVNLSKVGAERDALVTSLSEVLAYSSDRDQRLAERESELANLKGAYSALEHERANLASALDVSQTQADLYRAQKFFFADELAWLGQQFGYSDIQTMSMDYEQLSGIHAPQSCEPEPIDRYLQWSPPTSTMYVVTPRKMGWPNYGWTIRENVTFGPEHLSDPGYVGSRGYELRYPLTGSFPLQEIHTTINVYDANVALDYWSGKGSVEDVPLNCGIIGQLQIAGDVDNTKTIYFTLGGYAANVKLKYFYGELSEAAAYLAGAANIVIDGLTGGW
jgi:hypothetical protein